MKNAILILLIFSFAYAQKELNLFATITGEYPHEQLDHVTKAGDVNGDGYDDFLAGYYDEHSVEGKTKLFFGKGTIDTLFFLSFKGDRCSTAGDVNGDGFDDILVGNPAWVMKFGIVHLYFGGLEMDTLPDFEFKGEHLGELVGSVLSPAGDVNGDGYDDFLIGAPSNWYDGYSRVYLFLGGENLSNLPFLTFKSDVMQDVFGISITTLDTNGDTYPDILVASQDSELDESGEISIYYSGPDMDSKVDSIFYITNIEEKTSLYTLVNLGDVNGDGYDDLIKNGSRLSTMYFDNDTKIFFKGESIGGGGDINNDGFTDILIGDGNYINDNNLMVGGVSVYFGGKEKYPVPDYFISGETKWGQFGYNLTIAGDLNRDGFDEICIVAPRYPHHEQPQGKLYIYSLGIQDHVSYNKNNELSFKNVLNSFPNPFNDTTTLNLKLSTIQQIDLQIFNIRGNSVKTIIHSTLNEGLHQFIWNGLDANGDSLPCGVYFAVLKMGNSELDCRKLILIK